MPAPGVLDVLADLLRHPWEHLIRRWNWKSALTSAIIRAGIFFSTNLTAGMRAAVGAMLAEFSYRVITSGFYGSATQAFRRAEPAWAAAAAVMILLPLASHSIEFLIHWLRGQPRHQHHRVNLLHRDLHFIQLLRHATRRADRWGRSAKLVA
jgi:hypothetical protein